MAEGCKKKNVEIWSYCLMPNHVHLLAVPQTEAGLRGAIGEAHRRYTRLINFRNEWRGHLWQGRFASFPMDEEYLLAAARYVELNPVMAGLVEKAEDYQWSSAGHHVNGRVDPLVSKSPLNDMISDWRDFLLQGDSSEAGLALQKAERTGRPLGSPDFVFALGKKVGRILSKRKTGPKPGS